MTTKTKAPVTATQTAVKAFANADRLHPPPAVGVRLKKAELDIFNLYQSARAHGDWSAPHLLLLKQLSQTTHRLDNAMKELTKEGDVVVNQRGTPVANPRFAVVDALTRSQLSLIRILAMAGDASGQMKTSLANRAKQEQDARKATKSTGKVSLLAGGKH